MAVTTPINNAVPSRQRMCIVEDVAEGDQIDVIAILGRPAKKARFFMTDDSDTISMRLNSLLRLRKKNTWGVDTEVLVWSAGAHGDIYSSTGEVVYETIDDVAISSIEITELTLSTGTTIEIVLV